MLVGNIISYNKENICTNEHFRSNLYSGDFFIYSEFWEFFDERTWSYMVNKPQFINMLSYICDNIQNCLKLLEKYDIPEFVIIKIEKHFVAMINQEKLKELNKNGEQDNKFNVENVQEMYKV